MPIIRRGAALPPKRLLALTAALALTIAAVIAGISPAPAQEGAPVRAKPVEENDYAVVVRNVVERHVRPATERLARAAELLAADLSDYCAAPTAETRGHLDRTFADAVGALAALDALRFGPLVEEGRLERLAFWPDPRGLGLKQVQALLAAKDPAVLEPGGLAGKSVAVQGLTALEFVLYGTGSDALSEPGSFRCRYGEAIAANVKALSAEVSGAWETDEGAAALYLKPGPENPVFRTHAEAAGAVIAAMATGLEILADQKIRTPLGETPERARPKLSFFWRSGQTFPSMVQTLEAIEHEYETSGVTDLLEPDQKWLGQSITFEIGQAIAKVRALRGGMEAVAVDGQDREKLKYIGIVASSLKRSIGRELAGAVGLEQSFNALDGD